MPRTGAPGQRIAEKKAADGDPAAGISLMGTAGKGRRIFAGGGICLGGFAFLPGEAVWPVSGVPVPSVHEG